MKTGRWRCPYCGDGVQVVAISYSPICCAHCGDFVMFIEESDQLELFPKAQPSYSPANQLAGDS